MMQTLPHRRVLFVLPHPDDESFVMGGTIARLALGRRAEVSLYTLTRGEASRNAALLGITGEELAAIRVRETAEAAALLGVANQMQGSWPDGGLRDLDPRVLEDDIRRVVSDIRPDVLVTFDVQGGSVHPDHIVCHHILKRVFVELREREPGPARLCFSALPAEKIATWPRKVFGVPWSRVHAIVDVSPWREVEQAAIAAHRSVRRDVEEHNYDEWMLWPEEYYSFFQEAFHPPVDDLLTGLD